MYTARYATATVNPSTTDGSVITAKPSVVFRVVGGFVVAGGTATNVTFNSKGTGTGTAISSVIYCGANGGLVMPSPPQIASGEPPFGYFQTTRGEGLAATTGSGTTVGISVIYVEI
mgnify:FL=1